MTDQRSEVNVSRASQINLNGIGSPVPTYGNYGGPGYTGGEFGGLNFDVPPTDIFDAAFREHDFSYYRASGPRALVAADEVLFDTIDKLKEAYPEYWRSLPLADRAYLNGVPAVFAVPISKRLIDIFEDDWNRTIMSGKTPWAPCFPLGTVINMSDGSPRKIEDISVGDLVLAFNSAAFEPNDNVHFVCMDASLREGQVSRLYSGVTDEWIELSFADPETGELNTLTTTPGHLFLNEEGGFSKIALMLSGWTEALESKSGEYWADAGTARIVLQSGAVVEAAGRSVKYSIETAHLFEETEMIITREEGGLAVSPEYRKGWKTYNFEVDRYHTYIAGGVRVHNDSTFISENYPSYDASSVFTKGLDPSIWNGAVGAPAADYANNGDTVARHSNGGVSHTNQFGVTTYTSPSGTMSVVDWDSSDGVRNPVDSGGGSGTSKPIVIDLDGDGVEIAPRDQNFTHFDFDDDGYDERSAWVGSDDGFLIFDEGNDGKITKARELTLADWTEAEDTDLEALRTHFDTNQDGVLDPRDDGWSQFKIWQDANSDGVVDSGELRTLAYWGVQAINLSYTSDDAVLLSDGTLVHGFLDVDLVNGSRVKDTDGDGKAEAADVALAYDLLGMKTTDNGAGTTSYELEYGATEKHRLLQSGEANFTIDHRNIDDNAPNYFIAATGNSAANTLNATHAQIGIVLDGAGGNDRLIGGSENDLIAGGAGADDIHAGAGHDTLIIDATDLASGSIDGGDGYDGLFVDGDANVSIVMEDLDVEYVQSGGGDDTIKVMRDRGEDFFINPATAELYQVHKDVQSVPTTFYQDFRSTPYNGYEILGTLSPNTHPYHQQEVSADYTEKTTDLDWFKTQIETEGGLVDGIRSFWVYSGSGNDSVEGAIGNDILIGGAGDDEMNGGLGNDRYFFDVGDGKDSYKDTGATIEVNENEIEYSIYLVSEVIYQDSCGGDCMSYSPVHRFSGTETYDTPEIEINVIAGYGGLDTIQLGYGIQFEDLSFVSENDGDLRIDMATVDADGQATNDSITLQNFNDERYRVEILAFANGMALDLSNVTSGRGTNAVNTLTGTQSTYQDPETDEDVTVENNDLLKGLGGNDTLRGKGGADFLYGGKNNDQLEGGADDDTYYWIRGDGHDTIIESEGVDGLYFGEGISFDDLTFSLVSGSTLKASIAGTGAGSVSVSNFDDADKQVEQFIFNDGVALYAPEVLGLALATDSNDTINWTASALWIDGGSGDDDIRGSAEADILLGGAGRDKIFGRVGDDVLSAGASSTDGWQNLYGQQGKDTYLYSKEDRHVFADSRYQNSGSADDDAIVFEDLTLADLTITTHDYTVNTPGHQYGESLRFLWNDGSSSGELRVDNLGQHINKYTFADGTTVSRVLDYSDTITRLWGTSEDDFIAGTSDRSYIYGGAGDDVLSAEANTVGNWQALYGQQGNDTYLYAKEDRHVFAVSYHSHASTADDDTIVFEDLTLADLTITTHDYTVNTPGHHNGEALRFLWNDGSSSGELRVDNLGQHINKYTFADGTTVSRVLDYSDTTTKLWGTGGDDLIAGTSDRSYIYGGAGDDRLSAGVSDNVGTQVLRGERGDDTYVISRDHGSVYAGEMVGEGTDTIEFTDLTLADITITAHDHTLGGTVEHWLGEELRLSWDGGNVRLREFGSTIEQFEFADGSVLSKISGDHYFRKDPVKYATQMSTDDLLYGTAESDLIRGGSGVDRIYGGNGDDNLQGQNGNDYLYGQGGNDLVYGGNNNDILLGGAGADRLDGGDGIDRAAYWDATSGVTAYLYKPSSNTGFAAGDTYISIENLQGSKYSDKLAGNNQANTIWGGAGDDHIYSGQSNDVVHGEDGNDRLYGHDDDDKLYGNDGNDWLYGQNGNDWLYGGSGSDTFVFGPGFGDDIIADFAAGQGVGDRLQFQELGVANFAQLSSGMTEVNGDTVIAFNDGSSVTLDGVAITDLHQDDFIFS